MTKDLTRRLKEHDHGKTKSLKSYLPVQLIHVEYYQNKKVALQREQQIKRSGKIRQELKKRIYTAPSSNG